MNLNQKRNITLWQFIGFAAVSLLGSLLHFLYDLTGSGLAALFSAVNESTWEHIKLLFFPMFAFAVVESFFFRKEYQSFWLIKLEGTLLGLTLIPVLFYTLRGIFGTTPDSVNITIFFVSAAIAFIYETKQFKSYNETARSSKWAFWGFCIITILFWIFTFMPPEIPLFMDPIDGSFGI